MKKHLLYSASALTLALSFTASAVQNGTPVPSAQHTDIIRIQTASGGYCTGTVVSGDWVLTAGHCRSAGESYIHPSYQQVSQPDHPLYRPDVNMDVALWKLSAKRDVKHSSFFSGEPVMFGDVVEYYGYGASTQLGYAVMQVWRENETRPEVLDSIDIGQGDSQEGDSGGAVFNDNGYVVGTNSAGATSRDENENSIDVARAIRAEYFLDFLQYYVNDWHYPTVADTPSGKVTIEVQSLFQSAIADSAFTTGDTTITGGSCVGKSVIEPFTVCSYELTSSGYEGRLVLSDSAVVVINKGKTQVTPTPAPNPGSDGGGSSGGSFGFSLYLLLLGVLFQKRLWCNLNYT